MKQRIGLISVLPLQELTFYCPISLWSEPMRWLDCCPRMVSFVSSHTPVSSAITLHRWLPNLYLEYNLPPVLCTCIAKCWLGTSSGCPAIIAQVTCPKVSSSFLPLSRISFCIIWIDKWRYSLAQATDLEAILFFLLRYSVLPKLANSTS